MCTFLCEYFCLGQVEDDYFPIVESAMDDSREALQRLCQQDGSVDPKDPPNNIADSVRVAFGMMELRRRRVVQVLKS